MPLAQLRSAFAAAADGGWANGADRLCQSCVELLEVDGAAISLMFAGESWGTLGASGDVSRRLDEVQFTFGEGPCVDAVTQSAPVLVADLSDSGESRWPAFTAEALKMDIRGVFALPVADGFTQVGALDLFSHRPRSLNAETLNGGLAAAEAAARPLLQLMRHTAKELTDDVEIARRQLAKPESWERVEVYQATGMIMAQLNVSAEEARVRLRGYAFANGMTASEVATGVINKRITLPNDFDGHRDSGSTRG